MADLEHVAFGVRVEDRQYGLPRIVRYRTRQPIRFLSVEPLLADLGPLDLSGIDWVIVGGESGPHARPGFEIGSSTSVVNAARCAWRSS